MIGVTLSSVFCYHSTHPCDLSIYSLELEFVFIAGFTIPLYKDTLLNQHGPLGCLQVLLTMNNAAEKLLGHLPLVHRRAEFL